MKTRAASKNGNLSGILTESLSSLQEADSGNNGARSGTDARGQATRGDRKRERSTSGTNHQDSLILAQPQHPDHQRDKLLGSVSRLLEMPNPNGLDRKKKQNVVGKNNQNPERQTIGRSDDQESSKHNRQNIHQSNGKFESNGRNGNQVAVVLDSLARVLHNDNALKTTSTFGNIENTSNGTDRKHRVQNIEEKRTAMTSKKETNHQGSLFQIKPQKKSTERPRSRSVLLLAVNENAPDLTTAIGQNHQNSSVLERKTRARSNEEDFNHSGVGGQLRRQHLELSSQNQTSHQDSLAQGLNITSIGGPIGETKLRDMAPDNGLESRKQRGRTVRGNCLQASSVLEPKGIGDDEDSNHRFKGKGRPQKIKKTTGNLTSQLDSLSAGYQLRQNEVNPSIITALHDPATGKGLNRTKGIERQKPEAKNRQRSSLLQAETDSCDDDESKKRTARKRLQPRLLGRKTKEKAKHHDSLSLVSSRQSDSHSFVGPSASASGALIGGHERQNLDAKFRQHASVQEPLRTKRRGNDQVAVVMDSMARFKNPPYASPCVAGAVSTSGQYLRKTSSDERNRQQRQKNDEKKIHQSLLSDKQGGKAGIDLLIIARPPLDAAVSIVASKSDLVTALQRNSPGERKRQRHRLESSNLDRNHQDSLARTQPKTDALVGHNAVHDALYEKYHDNRKRQKRQHLVTNFQSSTVVERESNGGSLDDKPDRKTRKMQSPTKFAMLMKGGHATAAVTNSLVLALSPPKESAFMAKHSSDDLLSKQHATASPKKLEQRTKTPPSKRKQQVSFSRMQPQYSILASVVRPFTSLDSPSGLQQRRKRQRPQPDSDDERSDLLHSNVTERRKGRGTSPNGANQPSTKRRLQRQSGQTSPVPPSPVPPQHPKQPWTQLTAFGQVLEHELHRYLNSSWQYEEETSDEDKLAAREMFRYLKETESQSQGSNHIDKSLQDVSQAEQRQLHTWVKAVQSRIHRENEVILDNVVTMWDIQDTEEEMGRLRQACMTQRRDNRRLERQVLELEEQVQQHEHDAEIQQRASDFLDLLNDM